MRIHWIDMLRGFCMICILYFHTEVYYAGSEVIPYALYVDNVLAVFFFLSGYLMLKGDGTAFNARHKLSRIVRSLLIPYFIFVPVIGLLKAPVHGQQIEILSILRSLILGEASWFISALIVAELILTLVLSRCRKEMMIWCLMALALLSAVIWANTLSPFTNNHNYWHVNEMSLGMFFMCLGLIYRLHETVLRRITDKWLFAVIAFLLLASTKYIILTSSLQMSFGPVTISSFPLFVADNLLAVSFLVALFRHLPSIGCIAWTGRHCIVYYFVCGGVPLIVSHALKAIGIPYGMFTILMAFLLVYAIASLITFLIYRYTPFVIGAKLET